MSDNGEVVDARCLREGEEMCLMVDVEFPCHIAKIRNRLDPYHLMMASMPQIGMIRSSANWWLYRSPADGAALKAMEEIQFQSRGVNGSIEEAVAGPAQPDKGGDKRGVEPARVAFQTLTHLEIPEAVAAE
jgi:hypothetical protein